MVQHRCVMERISTRRFGFPCRTCTENHGDRPCVVRINKKEYLSKPNCGRYTSFLENPKAMVRRKRSPRAKGPAPKRRKKARISNKAPVSKAVKNILAQNKLIHNSKKKKLLDERGISKSIWDPRNSNDDFKRPLNFFSQRSSSDTNDFSKDSVMS